MKPYGNVAGNSGIRAYETGADHILVLFQGNARVYRYSYARAGKAHVEAMKKLAGQGRGLSTYISQYVKDLYD